MRTVYLVLYSLVPLLGFTQELLPDILEEDCGGKKFIRVEKLPSVNGGETALNDSLSAYLKTRDVLIKNGTSTFRFLVTTKSQIFELLTLKGPPNNEMNEAITEWLKGHAEMWKPAVQNSHNVCAYVRLNVKCSGGKIRVELDQGGEDP